jgi:hypothetical protein
MHFDDSSRPIPSLRVISCLVLDIAAITDNEWWEGTCMLVKSF